jgi:type II secretory pathway component GspD/PulD (secretin)
MILKRARQKKIIFLFTLIVIFLSQSSIGAVDGDLSSLIQAGAETEKSAFPTIPGGMQGRISLDLRNIDIVDALKFVALKANLNIVATRNVSGRVTLTVEKVLVKDIFDIMLRSNGLAYVKQGSIYNIMAEAEYKALFGKSFSDLRQVKTFRLKYAIPEQAFTLLDTMKTSIGRVLVEPDSGTVLIMDTPDSIKDIEKALTTLEQKNLVRVFDLQYANAKDVEEQLKVQLDAKKVGLIRADERLNQVIVQALPERMSDVERLINALDERTKQVIIDTNIVKVKLSDQFDAGIEWEGIVKIGARYGMTYLGSTPFSVMQLATDAWTDRRQFLHDMSGRVGGYPSSSYTSDFSGSAVAPGEALHIGMVDRLRDFDMMLQYLQTLGNTQILSKPKLAVVNNQEARIHVGERQAYVTTTTTTGQTTTTVSEEVTFVDVGIQLSVTPTINDEGFITMKIKPEISSVIETLTTPSGNQVPIIDTSTAETTVMVKDGATIVIGGLRKEEKIGSEQQVPFMGNIPLLGFLFSKKQTTTERTELLIMITPHIVSGEAITTGDDRELGYEVSKGYRDYGPFTEESESNATLPNEHSEQKIKPYKDYLSFEEEE